MIGTLVLLMAGAVGAEPPVAEHLQEISVTIQTDMAEGSGVIITRELRESAETKEKTKVNFVWTAGHVIEDLRSVRTVVDSDGRDRKLVEFKEPRIVKQLVEDGRRVGEIQMACTVVKYSDSEDGHDLALLMVRKRDFVEQGAKFYLKDDPVEIGTELFHVGSLLGEMGANSMTSGIMSQVGRTLDLGSGSSRVFDQTTVPAFPGSSGGGVYFADGQHKGEYIGMLVRGAGESFNLIVPIRRVRQWCKSVDLGWAIDPSVKAPSLEEIRDIRVEEPVTDSERERSKNAGPRQFLIHENNQ